MALLVGFPGAKATRAIFGRKTHSLRAITLWQRLLVGSVWITRRNHYFAALKIIRGELLGVLIVSLISSHDVLAALFQMVLYDLDLIPDIMRALVQILYGVNACYYLLSRARGRSGSTSAAWALFTLFDAHL